MAVLLALVEGAFDLGYRIGNDSTAEQSPIAVSEKSPFVIEYNLVLY